MIDATELCIEEGQMVWVLYVDMYCLDYDGNMMDACLLALAAVLKTGRIM